MGNIQWMIKRIQCRRTTELGHDEVYYLSPACYVTPKGGQLAQILPVLPPGPDAARGGDAGGPGGTANTAWDCNDSGAKSDRTFGGNGVGLFNVPINPGDQVTVSLTLMESDGWSYTDATDAGAKVAGTILTLIGDKDVAGIVTGVASCIDLLKGFLTNTDDLLGVLTVVLVADADGAVRLVSESAYASSDGQASITSTAAAGQSAMFTAHTSHDRGIYDWTIALPGALMPEVPPLRMGDRGAFSIADLRPWDAPQPDNRAIVTFAQPFSDAPSVPIGLTGIDIDCAANVRISAGLEQADKTQMQVNINSWADTILYSGSCAWIEVQPGDPDIQSGQFSTTEDHAWDKPQASTSRRINFSRSYAQTPRVIIWLNSLDMSCKANWRANAYATDVTPAGFTLHLDTWADSVLYDARATWVAYSAASQNIASGSFSTNDIRPWNQPQPSNSGLIAFSQPLSQIPRVTVGLSSIDIDCGHNLRINASITNVSQTGMTWHLDSWADTVLYFCRR